MARKSWNVNGLEVPAPPTTPGRREGGGVPPFPPREEGGGRNGPAPPFTPGRREEGIERRQPLD